MKISACLITKNEERNIARCIESFKNAVDEIIVVDTGSVDSTVKIAKRLGAKVYYYKWNNNFSDARNYALKKAKGQWIIFLDADEYFGDKTGNNLKHTLESVHNSLVDGLLLYTVNLDDYGISRYGMNLLRIFRNNSKIKYFGSIHETVQRTDRNLNTSLVPETQLKLYHTGYSSDSVQDEKSRRNLTLLQKELNSGNKDPQIVYYITECYYWLKDYEMVVKYANKYLDYNLTLDYNVPLYVKMFESMIKIGYDTEGILIKINNALEHFPTHPDIHNFKSKVLFSIKNYSEAYESCNNTISYGFNSQKRYTCSSWPFDCDQTYLRMATINEFKNDLKSSENYLKKSLRQNKFNAEALDKLLRLIRNRHAEEIKKIINDIYDINEQKEMEFLVTGLAKQRFKPVIEHYYNILQNILGQDHITYLFLLLTIERYEEAYDYFIEFFTEENNDWSLLFALISAILMKDISKIELVKPYVKPAFRKIIEIYNGNEHQFFVNEEVNDYLDLLNEFVYLNAVKQIDQFLKMKSMFEHDISFEIGNFLMKLAGYDKAIEQFSDSLKTKSSNENEIYFNIGYCYYKMHCYEQALDFFNKAVLNGYKDNGIFEFISWIKEIKEFS